MFYLIGCVSVWETPVFMFSFDFIVPFADVLSSILSSQNLFLGFFRCLLENIWGSCRIIGLLVFSLFERKDNGCVSFGNSLGWEGTAVTGWGKIGRKLFFCVILAHLYIFCYPGTNTRMGCTQLKFCLKMKFKNIFSHFCYSLWCKHG